MKIELVTPANLWIWIVSVCGFMFSCINFFLGKYVAGRIMGNDLKHLTKDVDELKASDKDWKKGLKLELNKIFRRLGSIERNQTAMQAVCNERHPKK